MGDLFSQQLFLTSLLFLTPQLDFLSLSADNLTSTSSVPQNVSIHSFLFSYPSPLFSPKANLSTALDPSLPLPYGIPRGYFFSSGIFRLHLYWLCPAERTFLGPWSTRQWHFNFSPTLCLQISQEMTNSISDFTTFHHICNSAFPNLTPTFTNTAESLMT